MENLVNLVTLADGRKIILQDDEKNLIQTFRTGAWYKDEAETDENGDMYYEFGELNLFNLETYDLDRHTILVYPSDDWKEEETDVGTFLFSDIANGMLRVEMPWGAKIFSIRCRKRLSLDSTNKFGIGRGIDK